MSTFQTEKFFWRFGKKAGSCISSLTIQILCTILITLMIDIERMRLAIKEAEKNLLGIPAGGPFGACIVKDGSVIAVA